MGRLPGGGYRRRGADRRSGGRTQGRFVELLPNRLDALIRRHNAVRSETRRLRLRMALHAGELLLDKHGVTGSSVNFVFRLLDAAPLKHALAGSDGGLALVVSDWFYEEVVRRAERVELASYRPVHVSIKETEADAWVHIPGNAVPG
ncbi:hypothetical protein [Amycolatopsis sp. NPDC051102]|uniref:hypothetical protein n=1 Tax=Amycolatopsis sp. NPDC051102 TaxID=3155163 RepID=UPI003434D55E